MLKLIAPVSPFLSDKLYMTLTDDDNSVHLSEFTMPAEESIDLQLEEEMHLAQEVVYLIRSVRVKNNLKVRQPLRQILVPVLSEREKNMLLKVKDIILEEVNVKELNIIEGDSAIIVKKAKPNFKSIGPKFGKMVKDVQKAILSLDSSAIRELETTGASTIGGFDISREDVEIYTENIEGWIVDSHDNITIALDTNIDEDLLNEGIAREFISRVQNLRRTADLEVSDKVEIYLDAPEKISAAVRENLEYILNETSGISVQSSNGNDHEYAESEIHGLPLRIYLKKVV